MLHTFFFVLSFLMDYDAMAEALRDSLLLGLASACFISIIVGWLSFRGRVVAKNHQMPLRYRAE